MPNNFWQKLPKPVMALAPMADVTDAAFRQIIAKYGKPDVMYTEFVSADGLCSLGREKLLLDLKYDEKEHPIVAQIFSSKPEKIHQASRLCRELGFDGVDINMGCPEKSICAQGCGAALLKTPALARALIQAAIQAAGGLPVSIKARLGYSKKDELVNFLPELLKENLASVIFHARTKKEMSKVPADWRYIKQAVVIRNQLGSKTLIIGNGDVENLEQAQERVLETGCDGVMIGRGIFGNPWLFSRIKREDLDLEERFRVMIEHTKLYEKLIMPYKSFDLMKKHFKAYVSGFDGAKELRMELMAAKDASEVEGIIQKYFKSKKNEE